MITKKYLLFIAVALLWCGVFNPCLEAAIPKLINYQGKLTDASGNPLTGSYNITLRIYDAETAGNLLWQEAHTGVVVDRGVFSVLLGSVTNLSLAFDNPYFLEIKVGEEVMTPRQRMTSSGYAIRAEEAEKYNGAGKVGTKTVDETNIADGKILVYHASTGQMSYETRFDNLQEFTSSGVFVKPAGVTKVFVEVVGGGGGGLGGSSTTGGGGGAGYAAKICTLVGDVAVTVGVGGTGYNSAYGGRNATTSGGASSFGSFCTANGGKKGEGSAGGAGGTATGGDINIQGQCGRATGDGGSCRYGYGKYSGANDGSGSGYGGGGGGGTNGGTNGLGGVVIVRW